MVSVDYNCLWFKATDTVSRPYLCFYRLIAPELTFHFLLHGVFDDNSHFGVFFKMVWQGAAIANKKLSDKTVNNKRQIEASCVVLMFPLLGNHGRDSME